MDELESGFPILKRLEKVGINLDELDYLARRLDSFDGYEAAQFQAMAVRLGTFDMTDFINLTFCCQQATVITDFSDLEAVGRRHVLTASGGHMPVDELAQVDGRKEALKLILNEPGTITPYGVVYDNGMELEQLYREGGPFPEYVDRQYSMLLEASAGEGQSTLLLLPDSQARLERLLGRAGIQYSSQVASSHTRTQPAVPGGGADCAGGFENPGTPAGRQGSARPWAVHGRHINVNRRERRCRKKNLSGSSMS